MYAVAFHGVCFRGDMIEVWGCIHLFSAVQAGLGKYIELTRPRPVL